MNSIFI